MRAIISLLLLSASTLTSACIYPRDGNAGWSYDGATGPTLWDKLSSNNAACAEGKHQSPINIDWAISAAKQSSFDFPERADFTILNNGHTILAKPAEPSKFASTLGGRVYELLQFHFHTPSEHTLDGKGFPLEAHFVHSDADGKLAVFGIFFTVGSGTSSPFFHKMDFKNLSANGDSAALKNVNLKPIMTHVRNAKARSYSGSLTTPPCTEGVSWFVAEAPLKISATQYAALAQAMGFNARFTQGVPGKENILAQQCGKRTTTTA
ncbi:alpha carbonic anhydrase [Sphaerosporella brunnea]|uniref:Carbonic anhydrase n=1 Tax=Sphaerosporella brunnea TaxID=1250544 RepID=A0A5J5F1A0_9PEZI|nr:alpha carbonic anhydrase [Sphaerosporella brunnea]